MNGPLWGFITYYFMTQFLPKRPDLLKNGLTGLISFCLKRENIAYTKLLQRMSGQLSPVKLLIHLLKGVGVLYIEHYSLSSGRGRHRDGKGIPADSQSRD